MKTAIKQAQLTNRDVSAVIAKYLLVYRNTPHSTTGEAPSLLLMGRRLRTRLDLLLPSVEKHVEARQYSSMVNRTAKRGLRHFHAGDAVLARNYGRGEKWIPGVVTEVLGSRHYMIEVCGNLWKRHVDQLLRRPVDDTPSANSPAIQRHFVPNNTTSLVGQPVEIVPDSFSQGIPVPATAVSDEPHLMDSCEPCVPEGSITSSSCPVQDKDTNELTCSSSMPLIPVPAGIDDALTAQPDSTSEVKSTPTCTGKRYSTRKTRGPPSYLKDYELK